MEDTPRSDHIFHSARELELRYLQDEQGSAAVRGMEDCLGKSEDVLVGVEELETYLLGLTDVAGNISALAEHACVGNGMRRFELRHAEARWWPRRGVARKVLKLKKMHGPNPRCF